MKEIQIEELKNIQVQILDAVVQYCENNHLKYVLSYGTLLGAVRHKGYIPWDDDIDIAMPRPDYDRLVKHFNEQDSNYKVIHHTIDKEYPLPMAKVYDSRTNLIEFFSERLHIGVYIDIFPIDGLPDDKEKAVKCIKKAIFWRKVQNTKNRAFSYKSNWLKKIVIAVLKVPTLFISNYKINKILNKAATSCDYTKSLNVANRVAPDGTFEVLEKSKIYAEQSDVTFEGKTYKAPSDYDLYLKTIYGNYMQFPPIEQQVSEHFAKAYWK